MDLSLSGNTIQLTAGVGHRGEGYQMGGNQVTVSQKQAEKMFMGQEGETDWVQCCREIKMRPEN